MYSPQTLYYQNLNNFLKASSGLSVSRFSSVYASVKTMSKFQSMEELKLPLQITGRLITNGVYRDKQYGSIILSPEALKDTMEQWVGVEIFTHHDVYEKTMRGESISINEIVGRITKVSWNDKDGGIDFYADIFDQQIAYKMSNGLIRFISVGFARDVVSQNKKYYFMNIEPKEASLVYNPRDKNAEFKPV